MNRVTRVVLALVFTVGILACGQNVNKVRNDTTKADPAPMTKSPTPASQQPRSTNIQEPPMTTTGRTVRIEETTVATIDDWKVTVANILSVVNPEQPSQKKVTAQVGRYDVNKADQGERDVAQNDVLEIAGKKWQVKQIVVGAGADNGFVELVELR